MRNHIGARSLIMTSSLSYLAVTLPQGNTLNMPLLLPVVNQVRGTLPITLHLNLIPMWVWPVSLIGDFIKVIEITKEEF